MKKNSVKNTAIGNLLGTVTVILLFSFFCPRCSPHCYCNEFDIREITGKPAVCNVSIKQFPVEYIRSFCKKIQPNPAFNPVFFKRHDSLYLSYVSTNNELIFLNFFDSTEVHRIKFHFFGAGEYLYLMKFDADTLHMIDKRDTLYYQILITENFDLKILRKINLNSIVNIPNWFIHYNSIGNVFDYHYPNIFIPYGW